MPESLIVFNKPFGVLCQFTDSDNRTTLAQYIKEPGYYPAGRLDKDSEGLLLLTNDGQLQQRIADPAFKLPKVYLVQVEGDIQQKSLDQLNAGVMLKDGPAQAVDVKKVQPSTSLWVREPPIRQRQSIPTSWLSLTLREGRNRQVRRMTAAVDHPTLRLVRTAIGAYNVWSLLPGEYRFVKADKLLGQRLFPN